MVKRSRFVSPIMANGFCRGYRDLADPAIQWAIPGNPTAINPHDETFHVLHMRDGSLLQIGTSERNGGVTSVRSGGVHVVRHYDNGQCFLGNARFRADGVEQNPTEDGGSAGTATFYPSVGDPISVRRLPDGSLSVRRQRYALVEFDPDALEDNWGRRPVPANLPPDTQLLWTGCSMDSEHVLRADGRCHTYTFTFRDHDGSPPALEKAWLSCGMLLADVFRGGCDLIDLATGNRRSLRDEEWIGAPHPTIAGARRRGWNGFRSRVGLLDPGQPEVPQPAVWPSGHAASILYSGIDGAPDGRLALGIYSRLAATSSTDAIGPPERMEVKVMRNPHLVSDLSDAGFGSKTLAMRNSGYGVVVGSHGNGAYPAGHQASVSFDWCVGTPDSVAAMLRNRYLDMAAAGGV
jgi:hypothetical protein